MIELLSARLASARPSDRAAAEFLRLLADPTRRRIFLLLMDGESATARWPGSSASPQNLISHHLRQLRQAGLVRARRDDGDHAGSTTRSTASARRVHQEIGAAFDPDRWASASRDCGPASKAERRSATSSLVGQ